MKHPILVLSLSVGSLLFGPSVELRAQAANAIPPPAAAAAKPTGQTPLPQGPRNEAAPPETLVMSPFHVDASAQRGYFQSNTMSGTRLNSKIEDLAASITVVTKEQMADFAMLDINDVFSYEASTEGIGNYTDMEITAGNQVEDNVMGDPANANRIRGVGNANISDGNFETSGRVPVDPIAIDGVEISRGPNSSLFGLGNTAGSVNLLPASANLSRNRVQVQFRADTHGGQRASIDFNRVLKPGVLAVRGSAVFQHDGYDLKPSGTDSLRLNGMTRYRPFKTTTFSASYQHYKLSGNRPNAQMPRDAITPWLEAGAPTWDPLTATRYINGVAVQVGGVLPVSSRLRTLWQGGSFSANGHLYVDGDGSIGLWTPGRGTTSASPAGGNQTNFYYVQSSPSDLKTNQPLFNTDPVLSNGAIYDWRSINLAAMNSLAERTGTTRVQLEQIFFDSGRQLLAAQIGWYREDSQRRNRFFYGKADAPSTLLGPFLHIDPNTRLLTGAPNPYYLRPYISVPRFTQADTPLVRNTYRGELVYKFDLTRKSSVLRWVGRHQISGYTEYRNYVNYSFPRKDVLTSVHAWAPADAVRGSTATAAAQYNLYQHFYVGDNNGLNVDYAPSDYKYGWYDFTWGNALTGQRVEKAELGSTRATSSTGVPTVGGTHKIQKTHGGIIQSHLLNERVVTTFGVRRDENYTRSVVGENDWNFRDGWTRTAGIVVKPRRWLSFHANRSDSFIPSNLAQDLYGNLVPDPSGLGRDYGFTLQLFQGKLNIRVNQYSTIQRNSRAASSTSIASVLRTIDIDDNGSRAFGLNRVARNWIENTFKRQGINATQEQIDARLAAVMQMDLDRIRMMERMQSEASRPPGTSTLSQIPVAEPSSLRARGKEVEVNYNPSSDWTIKINLTEQETIDGRLAPNIDSYIAERLPVWEKIIDEDTGLPWFTSNYAPVGTATPSSYLAGTVMPRIPIAKATENKTRPQVRKYRVNLSQNLRLAAVSENRILKRMNVGGSLRWEDKGAIGYYGVQQLPEIITHLDATRPIWDKAHVYVDLFTAYRTRLFANRVGMTVQLNVRNLQESGRLQPVSAYPDGTPNAYRIIAPRLFIFTATFDL
jgi:outer membrane receptor protein involved in Fe transport